MTIQKAIKTNKKIRRSHKLFGKEWGYIDYCHKEDKLVFNYGFNSMPLTLDDILATDWEVVPNLSIEEKFDKAKKALKYYAKANDNNTLDDNGEKARQILAEIE